MKFEIYKSSGKFRWRLKADNGEIVAQGQSYRRKEKVLNAIALIKKNDDPVEDLTIKPASGGGPGPK